MARRIDTVDALARRRPEAVLSVDVEDYFHVEAFSDRVDRDRWGEWESRVEANTARILELFAAHGVRGTFFVLGWVAERFPRLVEDIAVQGHEVACHSFWHRLIYGLSRDEFRDDSQRAKAAVEEAAGVQVRGYRAPSFSVTERSLWALEVLAELGFEYDSSVFPIHHDVYGLPSAPRRPYEVQTPSGTIVEYPLTTFLALHRFKLPVGGGGYLRLLPWRYTLLGMGMAARQGLMPIVYVHPWEVDPNQPRIPGRIRSRLRHYTHLDKMETRLTALFDRFEFIRFCDLDPTEDL